MAKTKYQISALDYAEDYLERLFEIEDYIDRRLEMKINSIIEKKLHEHNLFINNSKNNYQHEQEK